MGKLKTERLNGTDVIQRPPLCSESELKEFHRLVLAEGKVTQLGLLKRIRGAKLLGFHYQEQRLVGVAALKTPNENYKNRVFVKAGVEHLSGQFQTELGWAVTREAFRGRGIGSRLIEILLNQEQNARIFATTASENIPMQRILTRFGFTKTGHPYGEQAPESPTLQLWLLQNQKITDPQD